MTEPGPTDRALGPWDHLRGALLALVLFAHAVYALPIPPAVSERRSHEEGVQHDVDTWLRALGAVGLRPDRETVRQGIVTWTGRFAGAHRLLKAPFAPVMDLAGASQSWALFAAISVRPDRLEVAVRHSGRADWEVVMRRLDPCCTWREEMLEYRRIRGVWDGQRQGMRPGYKGLTRWIADRAFEDFPDADRVRVRLLRGHLVYPWEAPNPTVDVVHERFHGREP